MKGDVLLVSFTVAPPLQLLNQEGVKHDVSVMMDYPTLFFFFFSPLSCAIFTLFTSSLKGLLEY